MKNGKILRVGVLVAISLSLLFFTVGVNVVAQPPVGYDYHAPIVCYNDTALEDLADTESWKGKGTSQQPYEIESYWFNETSSGYSIILSNTSLYVEILDCIFNHTSGGGIYLTGSQNVRVEDSYFYSVSTGVMVEECGENINVVGCEFHDLVNYGVRYEWCTAGMQLYLVQNNLFNGTFRAIHIIHTNYMSVIGNTIENFHERGIFAQYCELLYFRQNILQDYDAEEAAAIYNCSYCIWWNSTIGNDDKNSENGLIIYGVSYTNITESYFKKLGSSVITWVDSNTNNDISNNVIIEQNGGGENLGMARLRTTSLTEENNDTNYYTKNYWSGYTGVDEDEDGFGDTPYPVKDQYGVQQDEDVLPRMEPFVPEHEITEPTVIYPNGGETISGNVTFSWEMAFDTHGHDITYEIWLRRGWRRWYYVGTTDRIFIAYDTTDLRDSDYYRVYVYADCSESSLYEYDRSDSYFTIDNNGDDDD